MFIFATTVWPENSNQPDIIMKMFKRIAVACAALMLLTSCSILKNVASNAVSTGSNTGAGLAAIYNVLKATGGIDLSNLANIINIGKILTGANALTDATSDFTNDFITGLIKGSSNLVNNTNASSVISGLQALSKLDTSALSTAAAAAAAGQSADVSTSPDGIAATVNVLKSIVDALQ